MRKRMDFDFLGKRNVFFAVSGVLIAISIAALIFKGLVFGIEFQGGTVMTLTAKPGVTAEQVRKALEGAGDQSGAGFLGRDGAGEAAHRAVRRPAAE